MDIDKILENAKYNTVSKEEAMLLFEKAEKDVKDREKLLAVARFIRQREMGDTFYHHGGFGAVLPCKLKPLCLYCPYWREKDTRTMTIPEILVGVRYLNENGIYSYHLSGGSDLQSDGEDMIEIVEHIYKAGYRKSNIFVNCGASISLENLRYLKKLGVKRMGSVFETMNPVVFKHLKPGDNLQEKIDFAHRIGECDIDLGTGFMAGIGPEENHIEDYIHALFAIKQFPHLTSVYFSKFTQSNHILMENHPNCSLIEAVCLIAIARLVLRNIDISPAAGWTEDERPFAYEAGAGNSFFSIRMSINRDYWKNRKSNTTFETGAPKISDNRIFYEELAKTHNLKIGN